MKLKTWYKYYGSDIIYVYFIREDSKYYHGIYIGPHDVVTKCFQDIKWCESHQAWFEIKKPKSLDKYQKKEIIRILFHR